MRCRRLQPGDASRRQQLAELHHAAFELEDKLETFPEQLEGRLANTNFIAYILESEQGQLVGALLLTSYPPSSATMPSATLANWQYRRRFMAAV